MQQKLFDEICEFCKYLTDWEDKKDYYVEKLLPDWVDGKRYGLDKRALLIFNNIYDLTPGPELKNLASYIIEIKEDKENFIYKQKKSNILKFLNGCKIINMDFKVLYIQHHLKIL